MTMRKGRPKNTPQFFPIKPSKPTFEARIGFIPAHSVYIGQDGDTYGPREFSQWFYETENGQFYSEDCLKILLRDCVPDSIQNNDLLLSLADTYRAATSGKA